MTTDELTSKLKASTDKALNLTSKMNGIAMMLQCFQPQSRYNETSIVSTFHNVGLMLDQLGDEAFSLVENLDEIKEKLK